MEDFDHVFAASEKSARRTIGWMFVIIALWLLFVAGAVCTVIWLAGRFLGVW